jgi:hypothetical protein
MQKNYKGNRANANPRNSVAVATPWGFDEESCSVVSQKTGEVVFELNIKPLQASDKMNILGMIKAVNSGAKASF